VTAEKPPKRKPKRKWAKELAAFAEENFFQVIEEIKEPEPPLLQARGDDLMNHI
jgi:hypothetical protein